LRTILAVLELADANLRTLEVDHDADRAVHLAAGLAHQLRARQVVLGRAVGEIQAHHVHAGEEHALEDTRLARRRAERGHDLGAAGRAVISAESHLRARPLLEDLHRRQRPAFEELEERPPPVEM
jgi:hypothetical protein